MIEILEEPHRSDPARRRSPVFVGSGEYLLVEWRWRGELVICEHASVEIGRPEDAFGHLCDEAFRIHVFRPGDDTMDRCEDVTEQLAALWLARHVPDPEDPGELPLFVRLSLAYEDWQAALRDGAAEW